MRIAVFQANPVVGDFAHNLAALRDAFTRARDGQADAVVCPRGALAGAPLEGLARRRDFAAAMAAARARWIADARALGFRPAMLRDPSVPVAELTLTATPNTTTVSMALSQPAPAPVPDDPGGDADLTVWLREGAPPWPRRLVASGSAWLFRAGASRADRERLRSWCRAHRVAWIAANLAGGQDEAVFAGGSLAVNADGGEAARGAVAQADFLWLHADAGDDDDAPPRLSPGLPDSDAPVPAPADAEAEGLEELFQALTAGLRDYLGKNRLAGAVLGLSGGIDSALAAALAVEALGPSKVRTLTLPGPFTSEATLADALALAENLGIRCDRVAIEPVRAAAEASLAGVWGDGQADPGGLTGQNLQARARGMLLMGLANRLGYALLNTSNASEGAMGYGTLYGDLVGTFAPLGDLPKLTVWALSRHVNARAGREIIPVTTIDRVPSAELAPNQEDRHSIPDYPTLDPMLALLRAGRDLEAVTAAGHPRADAETMFRLYGRAEYKRRQGIPSIKVLASWQGDTPTGDDRGTLVVVAGIGDAEALTDANWPLPASCLRDMPPWGRARWPMTQRL